MSGFLRELVQQRLTARAGPVAKSPGTVTPPPGKDLGPVGEGCAWHVSLVPASCSWTAVPRGLGGQLRALGAAAGSRARGTAGWAQAHLHGQHPGGHLGRTQAPQEVVQHLARGLLVGLGAQKQVLQAAQQLLLLLLPLQGQGSLRIGPLRLRGGGAGGGVPTCRFLARCSLLSPSSSSPPEAASVAASCSRNSHRHCTGSTSREPSLDCTRSASQGMDCDEAWQGRGDAQLLSAPTRRTPSPPTAAASPPAPPARMRGPRAHPAARPAVLAAPRQQPLKALERAQRPWAPRAAAGLACRWMMLRRKSGFRLRHSRCPRRRDWLRLFT